jgi:flagellar motor switch protein FliN/FliY
VEAGPESVANWFFDALKARLTLVFESMTGARPEVQWESLPAAPEAGLRWRQHFTGGPVKEAASAWIVTAEADWIEGSKQVLAAAGIEDGDEATLKSTHTETLGQVLTGIAQDMSARVGHEVTCTGGEESPFDRRGEPAGNGPWARFHIQFASGGAADFLAGVEQNLLDSLVTHESPPPEAAAAKPGGEVQMPSGSKTFELLLDVELPVSVSFGRAQVPLKDVLKLTTGSIVELNRSIAEPVEVIVNNCVIARGVVVVVEGNFGVRIHEVISRQERLRTLN